MSKFSFIALWCISLSLFAAQASAATVTTTCSPSQTANSCDQCFYSDNNVYLGYRVWGFYDVWHAGSNPDEVYLNENPSPVRFWTSYPGDVLQYGTMTAFWQGTSYTDPRYGPYIPLASNSSTTLLTLDPSYKVGLVNVSPAIKAAGRNSPIFGLDYVVNYWEVGSSVPTEHKECIVYYPAWCGDGVVDSTKWETCDAGANNGQPGQCNNTCNGNVPLTPVNGVCGAAHTVATATAPANNLCAAGTASVVAGTGPWTWSCVGLNGGSTASCNAPVLPPPPPAPVCSTVVTGALSGAISAGVCNIGTPVNFTAVGANPINYTWQCRNTINQITNCSASYSPPPPSGFSLSLKKYVNTADAQPIAPVEMKLGDTFNYIIRVTNNGPGPVSGVTTVSDFLPLGVVLNGTPSGAGWSCNVSGINVTCTSTNTPTAGVSFSDISIPVRVVASTGMITNTALVSNPNDTSSTPGDNTDPGVIIIFPTPICNATLSGTISTQISASTPGLCTVWTMTGFTMSANSVTPGINNFFYNWSCQSGQLQRVSCNANTSTNTGFALSLKKYVNSADAQPGTPVVMQTNDGFNYIIRVTNNGPIATSGLTTVTDTLPVGVVQSGTVSAGPWACTTLGATITCTVNAAIAPNTNFPDIIIPVRVTATSGTISNVAVVNNGSDSTPGDNTDPADIIIGNSSLTIKKAVNGQDGQTLSDAAQVAPGNSFSYTYVVTNNGTWPANSVTVTDTFPRYVSVTAVPTGTNWTCTRGTKLVATVTYHTVICTYNLPLAAGATAPTITVPSLVDAVTPAGTALRNIAYVCATGSTSPECNPGCTDPNNPSCTPPPPPPNCDNPDTGINKDPACVVTWAPAISLKKYVKEISAAGDTQTAPTSVTPGETFSYFYTFQNTGSIAATGVVIKDTFPEYLSHTGTITVRNASGTDVTADWTCVKGTYLATTRITLVCTKNTQLPANSGIYTMTIPVSVSLAIPTNMSFQNIAYICATNATNNPTGPNGEVICGNPNPPPPPPPGQCDQTNPTSQKDPACIIVGGPSCGTLASSPASSPLPPSTDVTYTCAPAGSGYTLANLEYAIKCDTTDTSSGAAYTGTNTRVCRTSAANAATTVITCAVRDRTTGSVFTGSNIGACRVEKTTTGWGGGGGSYFYVPTCVNGIRSCSQQLHSSLPGCNTISGQTCYTALSDCNTGNTLTCSGPGGGGGGGGWGGGGGGSGYCGDGVLGSSAGEECDVKGVSWCDASCKIVGLTNPGANAITDLWMTIPVLSRARLGYSWLDAMPGKIAFADNKMVIWVGTKAFTLADTIGFGIKQQYQIPLIVESNKKICLNSTGNSITNNTICTTFGALTPQSMKFTPPGSTLEYVLIGNGEYQIRQANGSYVKMLAVSNPNNVTLFKGNNSYATLDGSAKKLSDVFIGKNIGTDGRIGLYHMSTTTNQPIDLVGLDVRVSSALVGTTSSTVNRKIASYLTNASLVDAFLSGFRSYTATSVNTNTTSTVKPVSNITVSGNTTGNKTVSSLADLETLALNGNKNILTLKNGTLTIDNCTSNEIVLTGVRTVIVEGGDIIFRCNVGYGSSDTTSSWAWIAKGGNIVISTNVMYLAGVYVAIPEGAQGGKFTPQGGTTNNILRLNGSMYGNAKDLFDSRLYVRGTNAYDILTTGVILSYSNRALSNPPPLLSEYLNNYSITRVVK